MSLTVGVLLIAFAMSVIEKVGEFLNMLTMQYEVSYRTAAPVTLLLVLGQI